MIDNPISWGILVILAIIGAVYFLYKIDEEKNRIKKEEEEFWRDFWE